jgi:hypothetical protein
MHNHKLNIRRLDSCSLQSAVEIWNESFEGYRVDLKLSLDGYITRLHNEALSPEHSFIAFVDGDPVGFLLNGIRTNAAENLTRSEEYQQ